MFTFSWSIHRNIYLIKFIDTMTKSTYNVNSFVAAKHAVYNKSVRVHKNINKIDI